nr:hypothetical protein CFP56_23922 [Quercus suber]
MTGPATFPAPAFAPRSLSGDLAGLRAESKRRRIEAAGSEQELHARLSGSSERTRAFTTSRPARAVHDASTIDFAFLPAAETLEAAPSDALSLRVPIIPTNFAPLRTGAHGPEPADAPVMKAEISSMSGDAVFAPMADSHDDHAMHADFQRSSSVAAGIAASMAAGLELIKTPVVEQLNQAGEGIVGQLWRGMVEDVFGRGNLAAAR